MRHLALLTALFITSALHGAGRHALILCNQSYKAVGELRTPLAEAREAEKTLATLGFAGNITVVTDATTAKMTEAVDAFTAKLGDAEVALFFYGGHAIQAAGENYLLGVDSDPATTSQLAYKALPLGRVLTNLEGSGARLNLLILDCCRDNPLPTRGRNVGSTRGLAPMANAPKGTFIAYAADANQQAWDDHGQIGLYGSVLFEKMKTPGLRLEDIFIQTREDVAKIATEKYQHQQEPAEYSKVSGAFYFVPATFTPTVSAAPSTSNPAAGAVMTPSSSPLARPTGAQQREASGSQTLSTSSKTSAATISGLVMQYAEKALQELNGIDAELLPSDRSNLGALMNAEAQAATTKIQALCEIAAIKNQNDDAEGCRQIFETAKKLAEGISLHKSYWILSGDESFLLPRLSLNTIPRVFLEKSTAFFCIAKSEHFSNFKDDECRRIIMRPSDEWMNDELRNDAWLRAIFLARLAEVQMVLGEIESGEANFEKAMETAGKQKNTRNRLKSLVEIQCIKAAAHHHVGDHVKSLQVLTDAIAKTKEANQYWSAVENLAYIARVQILLGERELGRQSFQLALSTALKMQQTYEKGASLKEIAELQAISGETDAANETLQQITDRYEGGKYEYKNEGLAALERAGLFYQRVSHFEKLEKSSSQTTHDQIANMVSKMTSSLDRCTGYISMAKGLLKN